MRPFCTFALFQVKREQLQRALEAEDKRVSMLEKRLSTLDESALPLDLTIDPGGGGDAAADQRAGDIISSSAVASAPPIVIEEEDEAGSDADADADSEEGEGEGAAGSFTLKEDGIGRKSSGYYGF